MPLPSCYFDDESFADSIPHWRHEVANLGEKDGGAVYECRDCGLVFSPKWNKDEYLELYTTPGRYFQQSVGIGYQTFQDRWNHDYSVGEVRIRNLVMRMSDEQSVLDVGCGNCALLARLKQLGVRTMGVDLDSFSVNAGLPLAGQVDWVQHTDFLSLQVDDPIGVIMFTDSFEHFMYPSTYASHAAALLDPNGMIVIEMPDTDCDSYRLERIAWRHVKPREHPYLYQAHHVSALFEPVGMHIVDTVYTIPGRVIYYLRARANGGA